MKLYVITNIETVAGASNLNDLNYRIVTTKPEAIEIFEDWSLWQQVGGILLEEYDTVLAERLVLAVWHDGKVEAKNEAYASLAKEINENLGVRDDRDEDVELEDELKTGCPVIEHGPAGDPACPDCERYVKSREYNNA